MPLDLQNVSLSLVEDFDEAQEFMRWLGERRDIIAVDTETTGLNWWEPNFLRLVQFGDTDSGWAIPWDHWSGLLLDAFRRYDEPIVMHNCKFDLRALHRAGCSIKKSQVHDTRIMAHQLDPINSTGLKPLGIRYVNPLLGAGQDDLKTAMARNGWNWATIPCDFGPYWTYGALDTVITANLYETLKPQLYSRESYELELASTLVLMDIESKGARINVAYCEEKFESLSTYVEDMEKYIKETYGCGVSNRAVAAKFLSDGVILTERTDTGEWKMNKEVLDGIDHPLAFDFQDRKKAQRTANAYFRNLLQERDGDLVHPDINPLGARTSRMSVGRPALQQIPQGRLVRDAFIPREGNKLIDVDFDQVEYRLMSHFSEDEGMISAFREADAGGGDFFTNLARQIYSDASIEKSDARRQITKGAAYAKAYGAGTEKFSLMAGISIEEAEAFIAIYDATFPGVKRFQRSVDRVARERIGTDGHPYVTTAFGRRLVGDEDKIYALVDYVIQGSASDLFKQKIVDLDDAGLAGYIVLPVHDELLFDVPEEDVAELAPLMAKIMSEKERFRVPITCSPEVGMSWGEIH